MSDSLHSCTLPLLSLVSLVVPVAVEQPQPHLSHLLSLVLTQIYSPTTSLPTCYTEWKRSYTSTDAAIDEKCRILLDQVERNPSEISQAPILRTSPLGVFIRKTSLRFRQLGFEEFARWLENAKRWFELGSDGRSRLPRTRAKAPLSNARALLSVALTHFEHGNFDLLSLALAECFKISRSCNDRSTLRGCWSLLKRIPLEYRSKFLDDVGADSDAHSRRHSRTSKGKKRAVEDDDLSNPHDILFEVYRATLELDDDDGGSRNGQEPSVAFSDLFSKLYAAQTLAISSGNRSSRDKDSNKPTPASSSSSSSHNVRDRRDMFDVDLDTFAIELRFVQSELWARIGISSIAEVYRDLVLEETPEQLVPGSAPFASSSSSIPVHPTTTDLRLRTLLERARDLSNQGDHESNVTALKMLLTSIETDRKRSRIGLGDERRGGGKRAGETDAAPATVSINAWTRWKRQVLSTLVAMSASVGDDTARGDVARGSPSRQRSTALKGSITAAIESSVSRLETTSCTNRDEALKGLQELERIEHQVLIASREAAGGPSKWLTVDSTVYESLYGTRVEVRRVSNLLESLAVHLSLSNAVSIEEASEWTRRAQAYRVRARATRVDDGSRAEDGMTDEAVDRDDQGKKVLEIVELVRGLL
ncbi:hypothetical protein JCM3766R1_003894 [Sporobolomyces carnicolor]